MTQATPTQATDASPAPFRVRVTGDVQHRIGDGALETIPVGQEVEVDEAIASMVLSWKEDGQGMTAILAKNEFQHYMDTGAIVAI
jgi:hypothetical protein